MSPLEARKQLLIAESEINRAQLAREFELVKSNARALRERAKSFGSLASSVAAMVTGLSAFRGMGRERSDGKRSWVKTILKVAGFAANFWLAFRSPGRERKEG